MMTIFILLLFLAIAVLSVFRNLLYTVVNAVALFINRIFGRSGDSVKTQPDKRSDTPRRNKHYDDSEGEYVDYEEVRK